MTVRKAKTLEVTCFPVSAEKGQAGARLGSVVPESGNGVSLLPLKSGSDVPLCLESGRPEFSCQLSRSHCDPSSVAHPELRTQCSGDTGMVCI